VIFHKEKKLCLFEPAKTGTQTARHFLKAAGWLTYRKYHIFSDEAIQLHPNLLQYKLYAYIRNPLDRFLSYVHHMKQKEAIHPKLEAFLRKNGVEDSIESLSYESFIDLVDKIQGDEGFAVMVAPQARWFTQPGTEALDFDNYEAELRRISGCLDPVEFPMEIKNKSTDFGKSVVTDKVRSFVREYYAVDYVLAKDLLGKEYA